MPESSQPDVTILVPALNEEDTIREVVERLLALPISKQIIVIDDGSTDSTGRILAEYTKDIEVITHAERLGKGMAIRSGLKLARGRATIIQDADLEYSPEQIPMLTQPILDSSSQVVFGTRFSKGLPKGMPLPNKIVNVLLRWSVWLLYGRRISDEATCYKALDTNLLRQMNLECVRFEFCPEVTAKSIRLGKPIKEIPITYEPRTKAAGKKIRWTDAPEAFWALLKHRFKKF